MARILLVKTGISSYAKPQTSFPLGILYLAPVARREGEHQVRILDMNIERGGVPVTIDVAQEFSPNLRRFLVSGQE